MIDEWSKQIDEKFDADLPFNTEGYNRAKAVLQEKYAKESEIIKCYVKEILDLPNITGTNPRKVAEFQNCMKSTGMFR